MTEESKPCPFCDCPDLIEGMWCIDDEEVEAWECNRCKAGAPKSVWDQRASDGLIAKVTTMRALQIEYFRTRDREILRRSKEAERELDRLLKGFEQPDMFYQEHSA